MGATLAAVLAGCGSDDTAADPAAGDPSASTSASSPSTPSGSPLPDWPACADVWQGGQDLPARYAGCLDGDQAVKAASKRCAFGLPIVSYADTFYAVTGHRINQVASVKTDKAYRRALNACQG